MKEFDFEAARQGAAVMTRNGHRAKILCFDKKGELPIVATIDFEDHEQVYDYSEDGTMPAPAPSRLFLVMRDDDYRERLVFDQRVAKNQEQLEVTTRLTKAAFPVEGSGLVGLGLTKREFFSGLAMQGWLSSIGDNEQPIIEKGVAWCVKIADALIVELNKDPLK